MRRARALAATCLLFGAASCEQETFDPRSRVTTLRVFSVQADLPYAHPGETVTLSATSYDPLGRPLTFGWAGCVNPSSTSVEGCFAKLAEDASSGAPPILALGLEESSFSFEVPSDAIEVLPPAARRSALLGVVSAVCPGELSLDASVRPLPFRCTDARDGRELGLDEYVVGLKRVSLREQDRNQNPSITRVTFDGEEWPADEIPEVEACDENSNVWDDCDERYHHDIAVQLGPESQESGTTEAGSSFEEQLIVEYYATEGLFQYDVRIGSEPETRWVARPAARGSDVRLWLVVRDDRGGSSLVERTVRVR